MNTINPNKSESFKFQGNAERNTYLQLLHFHTWLFEHQSVFAIDHPSVIEAYLKLTEIQVNIRHGSVEVNEKDIYGQTHEDK